MNTEKAVSDYLSAWNETDAGRRRAAIERLCTGDCSYTDPLADVKGQAAIDGLIGAVQKQFAGFEFTLAGKVDAHHGQARFTWHAAPKGAKEPVVIGFDVLVMDGEKIRGVYGFLDKVPG